MRNLIYKFIKKDNTSNQFWSEIENLKSEINLICDKINKTDMWFESERNEDLIDACIYQREFLNSRYRYLLKKIKEMYKSQHVNYLGSDKNGCL
mgnify:CR=1 FL=1